MNVTGRFWAKVKRGPDCWEWTGARSAKGYGHFGIDGRHRIASRVAWELTQGPIPDGMFVCHTCDNPPCVNPAHLFLGTAAENQADAVRKGRIRRGSRHGQAKLTEADVRAIRASAATHTALARRFGVHRQSIANVRTGTRWAWLP